MFSQDPGDHRIGCGGKYFFVPTVCFKFYIIDVLIGHAFQVESDATFTADGPSPLKNSQSTQSSVSTSRRLSDEATDIS